MSIGLEKNNRIIERDGCFIYYDDTKNGSVNLVVPEVDKLKVLEQLGDIDQMDDNSFEAYRIGNGIPGEKEMDEQINPMENGLTAQISFNKGCYIGQEVIARLDAQGKIPKQMVLLSSDQGMNEEDKIYPEGTERECGFVTSKIQKDGRYIGLGFIRSASLDYEKEYELRQDGSTTKIKISKII